MATPARPSGIVIVPLYRVRQHRRYWHGCNTALGRLANSSGWQAISAIIKQQQSLQIGNAGQSVDDQARMRGFAAG